MPVITQITTHIADAKARLLSQFQGKTRIEGLLDAFSQQVQDYEDAVIPLESLLDIATQEGAQLDGIGTILGEAREGRTDADYRTALTERIAALYSSGEPEAVIQAYILATGSASVLYAPDYPAKFEISGDGSEPDDLLGLIEASAPAGVGVKLIAELEWDDSDGVLWDDGDTALVAWNTSG